MIAGSGPVSPAAPRAGGPETVAALSPVARGVVLTVVYSDLFDFPLTVAELRRYLVVDCPEPARLDDTLASLEGRYLRRTGDYVTLAGRERIVALRRRRQGRSERGWRWAARYARWLSGVPFVRMVAVCGSLAAGNADADGDVDVFIITAPDRLWTAQVCAMTLRRLAAVAGVRVCPNYFLTLDTLAVEPRNLYSAREVTQAVPLVGHDIHARFLDANRWTAALLPNAAEPVASATVAPAPARAWWTRAAEGALAGAVGAWVDRALHRMLLAYYALRRAGDGWPGADVRRAYRRDRQTVVGGGYGPAVERAYRDHVARVLGDEAASELDRLFPPDARHADGGDRHRAAQYDRIFAARYGRGR